MNQKQREFQTIVHAKLLADGGQLECQCFLVERGTPGYLAVISAGQQIAHELKLEARESESETT